MPQVALAAAASAALSTAAGYAAGTIATTALAGAFVKAFVINLALGALSSALQKKPSSPDHSLASNARERTITSRQPVAPQRVIYGRARVGGTYVFLHTTGASNEYFHMVIALAGHEVESIDTMYFDDEAVPVDGSGNATGNYAGYVSVVKRLGTDSQTAVSELVTAAPTKWTSDHRGQGIAYVYVKLTFSPDKFPNGVPNIKFDVQGKNSIYDPRTTLTGYSENASLCVADYLNDPKFGLNAAYGTDIDAADLIESANISDEAVALLAGGTESRYTCNGTFDSSETPANIIGRMLTASMGNVIASGGVWRVRAAAYRAPTITLTEDDFRGPINVTSRISRDALFNGVRGVYVSPDNAWMPSDFPAVTDASYVTEDNGEEIWRDVDLGFTLTASAAQRLAMIDLQRNRRQITVTSSWSSKALRLITSDTVNVTFARYGWAAKVFEVADMTLRVADDGLFVDMTLREVDSTVYSWTTGDETAVTAAPTTDLPSATAEAPSAITITENPYSLEGTVTVGWTAPATVYSQFYQVEYMAEADSSWTVAPGRTEDTTKIITNLPAGNYYFRVKSFSVDGSSSGYLTSPLTEVTVPSVMPRVSGLELRGDLTNSLVFTGKDAKFVWREASQTLSYDIGSEPQGGNSGTRDVYFKDYEVRILDTSDTVLRVEHTLDPFYDYTFEKNAEDNDGTPQRSFTIEVYQRGSQNQISGIPARMTVSNPAPGQLTSLAVRASFKYVFVEYTPDDDLDFDGVQVFMDTSSGFTPSASNLVATTISRIIGIDAEPDTQYYIKVGAFDAFGTAGMVYSTEVPVRTSQVNSPDIAAGSITADMMSVSQLSAIAANVGTLNAGTLQNSTGTFVVDLDNGTMTIAGPSGQAADDYMVLNDGVLEFYHWNGATHDLAKAVTARYSGIANNGDTVTIPGYISSTPTVIPSVANLEVYDQGNNSQSQALELKADNLREDPAGSGTWKFEAIAKLNLSDSQGTTVVNESSGATSSDTFTAPAAGTVTTPDNTEEVTVYVNLRSVRGTGTVPTYYKRKVDWRIGRRLTGTTSNTFTADAGTDICSATAHGYADASGPYRLTTTDALPAGLAVDTDYWIIYVTSGTFKLAISEANAIAGTPVVDITDTGSGTHTIGDWIWTTDQQKDMPTTSLDSVADQRTVTGIAPASYDLQVYFTAADLGGTFDYGSTTYDYSSTVKSTTGTSSADGEYNLGELPVTANLALPSYTPPAGWEIYNVEYSYVWAHMFYNLTYGAACYATGPGLSYSWPGYPLNYDTYGDTDSRDPTPDNYHTAVTFSSASYSTSACYVTASGGGSGSELAVTIKDPTATIYIRKPQVNSTTADNTFEFQKYDWELAAASTLTTGSLNWIAFGPMS